MTERCRRIRLEPGYALVGIELAVMGIGHPYAPRHMLILRITTSERRLL